MDDVTKISSGTGGDSPQRIGSYTVLGKLGEGGMGAVFKAHDPALDRVVALKLLPAHAASDPQFISRFRHEAMAAAKLNHPNIVQVHAAGEDAGTQFIVMEFVEGRTLHQHIQRHPQMACAEALAITVYVAEALRYAWNKARIIHRDIKPANILLSLDGEVKLADLGLAKSLHAAAVSVTSTGTIMGSAQYISPEQARGDKDVDFRTDIYSLGCTLYHMLTGRVPFEGEETMALLYKHVHEPHPDPRTLCPDCPANVAAVVLKMMAKDRNQRPASYDSLIAELTALHNAAQEASAAAVAAAAIPTASADAPTMAAKKLPAQATPRDLTLVYAGLVAVAIIGLIGLLVWAPWKRDVAAPVPGRAAAPRLPPGTAATTPAGAFVREVAALPAEEQVKRVVAKVKELNPGFDGKEVHRVTDGHVDTLGLISSELSNIAPVAALKKLEFFGCGTTVLVHSARAKLTDLSPLKGLPLKFLQCPYTSVRDLSPLQGMPLTTFCCNGSPVSDLSPLRGLPLVMLNCQDTDVRDLSVLRDMPLRLLFCDPAIATDEANRAVLRSIKTLQAVNNQPVAEFWKQVDADKLPGVTAWIPLNIAAACNANVIRTEREKVTNAFGISGRTWATTEWLRTKGFDRTGLPDDGQIAIPNTTPDGFFQLHVADGKDSILVSIRGESTHAGRIPTNATLNVAANQQRKFSQLAFLHASAPCDVEVSVTIRYDTGPDGAGILHARSWSPELHRRREPLAANQTVAIRTTDGSAAADAVEMLAEVLPVDPQRALKSLAFTFRRLSPKCEYPLAAEKGIAGIFAISALPADAVTRHVCR